MLHLEVYIQIMNNIPVWLGKDYVHIYDSEMLVKKKLRKT